MHVLIKEKKNGSKREIRRKISKGYENIGTKFLTDTLAKMSQNICSYFFVSGHFASFYLRKKHLF